MTTATVTKTSQRAVKVVVKPATGKPVVYRFENQGVGSRASKWLQARHPLAVAIDETTAELTDGSVLKVERGATVGELYPITEAAPTAAPTATAEPEPVVELAPSEEVSEEPAEAAPTAKKPRKPAAGRSRPPQNPTDLRGTPGFGRVSALVDGETAHGPVPETHDDQSVLTAA